MCGSRSPARYSLVAISTAVRSVCARAVLGRFVWEQSSVIFILVVACSLEKSTGVKITRIRG